MGRLLVKAGLVAVVAAAVLTGCAVPPSGPTSPGAPSDVTATLAQDPCTDQCGDVVVTWSAPPNGGLAITGYNVYQSTDGGSSYALVGSTPALDMTVDCGTPTVSCSFEVEATNAVGTGPRSTPSGAVVTQGPPGIATALAGSLTQVPCTDACGQVGFTWDPAPSNGSAVTHYDVYRSFNGGPIAFLTSTASTGVTVSCGVANTCSIVVRAVNGFGGGSLSSASNTVATQTFPDAPGDPVAALNPGPCSPSCLVDLTWAAPGNDGGSAIYTYNVYVSTNGGNFGYLTSVPASPTTLSCGSPGTQCSFKVQGVSSAAGGALSAASNTVTV